MNTTTTQPKKLSNYRLFYEEIAVEIPKKEKIKRRKYTIQSLRRKKKNIFDH